jgi:hypothetical protein
MALVKCILTPICSGYSVVPGEAVREIILEGGPARRRESFSGATYRVPVTWIVDGSEHKYLWAFYRGITHEGALPFLIDLVIHEAALVECQVSFFSGTFGTRSVNDGLYTIGADLEAVVPDIDYEADADFVTMCNEFGFDFEAGETLDDLNELVNEILPGDLPAP